MKTGTTNNFSISRRGESGNAFMIVMLGVVLFAALMFTFSRSARQGGENMSDRQAQLAIADILTYAERIESAANRTMIRGLSESQLSFENPSSAGYANGGCPGNSCKVFHKSGGAVEWKKPAPGLLTVTGDWVITGHNEVPDVGDDAKPDLVLMLPGLSRSVCLKINEVLKVANAGGNPPQDADTIDQTKFTGSFSSAARIGAAAQLSGIRTACVMHTQPNPDDYVFYRVLVER